jgi:hypothetical protein
VTGKKRKNNEEDDEELRELAKTYCVDGEEWAAVSKYNSSKLKSFVENRSFERSILLRKSLFDGVHKIYAMFLDKVSRGDGYVAERISSDQTLRDSIEAECAPLVKFLNNKAKIAFLSINNVVHGKMQQKAEQPTVEIEEEFSETKKDDSYHSNKTGLELAEVPQHHSEPVLHSPTSEAEVGNEQV